jgi:hypothetical protein
MLVKVPLLGTIGTLNATFKNSMARFKQRSSIFHNPLCHHKTEGKTNVKVFFSSLLFHFFLINFQHGVQASLFMLGGNAIAF